MKHLPHILGDKEDKRGQIIKRYFGVRREAFALTSPPQGVQKEDNHNMRHLTFNIVAMLQVGKRVQTNKITLAITQA